MDLRPVRKLKADDDLDTFDCGDETLNQWFKRHAFSDQQASASVTYVLPRGKLIVGFYTLTPHAVEPDHASPRLKRGLPAGRPIAVILLARLGLDTSEQGHHLGGDLLRNSLLRCSAAAEEIGGRAVVVHAKHKSAAGFYRHHGFQPLPENPNHLYLLMKDIRASIAQAQ